MTTALAVLGIWTAFSLVAGALWAVVMIVRERRERAEVEELERFWALRERAPR